MECNYHRPIVPRRSRRARGAGYPLIYLARRDGRWISVARIRVLVFLCLSLASSSSSFCLVTTCCSPRWRTRRALDGRGWYRHPLLSLLILSDHLPSTITLATPFCEETRRDNSRPTSPSRSLSFLFSLAIPASRRYEFLRSIAAILLLSRDLPFPPFLIREMEISLPRRGKSARHCSRVIAQSTACLEIFPFFFFFSFQCKLITDGSRGIDG